MPPARVDELKKRYEENPRRFFAPLANEYRKAGDLEAAIDLCKMHLEEQPGHLSGHIVYGQALFESSRPAEAKTIFEAALALDPENLIALRSLGDIARGAGDATTARHWYGRVLEADPRNDEVIALIDALNAEAPAPTVVVAEQHEPPPPPNYAEAKDEPPLEIVQAAAPTPVQPMEAVPAAPAPTAPPAVAAPRLSIGLMDLDLNLADSTAPAVDLLGAVAPSAAPPSAAPLFDEPPPVVEAPAPELVDELSLAGTVADTGGPTLEVQDTSFDAPSVDEAPMFAGAPETPAFGDSLDVTAGTEFDEPAEPRLSLLDASSLENAGDTVAIGEAVTDPRPISGGTAAPTEPAPATPADFDALFGNTPIADVVVGGGEATAPTEEAGFVADSFVGREPTDELLESAPDIATPPSPFVTETMAELYLQQGFREEALGVYRQLLAQNPDDAGLAERVKHLEHGTRSSLAIDSVSEEIEAAARVEEIRKSGGMPAVPALPAVPAEPIAAAEEAVSTTAQPSSVAAERSAIIEPPTGPAPIMEMIPEPTAPIPAVIAIPTPVAVTPIVEAEPVMEMVTEPKPVVVGPSVREVLSRIAARRAMPGGGIEPAGPAAATMSTVPAVESTPDATADVPAPGAERSDGLSPGAASPPAEVPLAPGGGLDRLFGMSGVVATDEGAALALSSAYGGVPAAPIKGEPTRRVTDELSLDSVFKDAPGAARQTGVQRQSTRLRFDQFFSGADGESAPAPPPSTTPAAPTDDIAQFTDWLKGLKGS